MDDLVNILSILEEKDKEISDIKEKIADVEYCVTFNSTLIQERDMLLKNLKKILEDTKQKIRDENTNILRKEAEIENVEQMIENQKELFQRQLNEEDRLQKEKFDIQKLIQSKLIYECKKREEVEQQQAQRLLIEKRNYIKRRDDANFKIQKAQQSIQTHKESTDIKISRDRNANSLSLATQKFKIQQIRSENETLEKKLSIMKKNQDIELNKLALHVESIRNQKDNESKTKISTYLTTIKYLKDVLQNRIENRRILMLDEMEYCQNNELINDEIHSINNSAAKNDYETKKMWNDWKRDQRKVGCDREEVDKTYLSCLNEGKKLQKEIIKYFETVMQNDLHWKKVKDKYSKYCAEKKSTLDEAQKKTNDMKDHLYKTTEQLKDVWNKIPIMQIRVNPEQERSSRKTKRLREVKEEYDALKKQALDLKGDIVKLRAQYNLKPVIENANNSGILSTQLVIKPGTNVLHRDKLKSSLNKLLNDIDVRKSQIHLLKDLVTKLNKKRLKLHKACVFATKLAGVPEDKLQKLLNHVVEHNEK